LLGKGLDLYVEEETAACNITAYYKKHSVARLLPHCKEDPQ